MNRYLYLTGILLGLAVPLVGIFVGLQVSSTLGTLLAFPVVAVSYLTGMAFGTWGLALWASALILSALSWTLIVFLCTLCAHFVTRRC